ncbi:FAD-binding oxidoreductase, partial [Salmonella enterica]|uniref:ferredoxin--NADP reductase n=1 Tax=Salmonella enterica TaxID=28901 RepID=UPI0032991F6E
SLDGKALAPFRAGQYLNLSVDAEGRATTRSYSLCGSPARSWQGEYDITVTRVVDDGFVSKFLQDECMPGLEISVSAPQGHLYYE